MEDVGLFNCGIVPSQCYESMDRHCVSGLRRSLSPLFSAATFLDDALTSDFESLSNQDSVVGLQLLEDAALFDDPERETMVVNSSWYHRR